jgi:hypothetical protein
LVFFNIMKSIERWSMQRMLLLCGAFKSITVDLPSLFSD